MTATSTTRNLRERVRREPTLPRRWLRRTALAAVVMMTSLAIGFHADRCSGGDTITVAVMEFEDTSPDSKFPKCNRALQSFLTTDLAQCGDIVVVERARVDQVIKELELAETGLLDPKQAAAVGKMLMADAVLLGSIWVAGEEIRLDARLVHVATSSVILGEKMEGMPSKFSSLEKQLAGKLVESLGVKLSAFQKASFERTHTESLRAASLFGLALDAEEQGDAGGARAFAEEAAIIDPDFEAARTIVTSVDDLLGDLKNERVQEQIAVLADFEDHLLHASLTNGDFGPHEFTAMARKGKPRQALLRWLLSIQGAVVHEDYATAFDDFFPGVKIWPYRNLFRTPNSRRGDGAAGACYQELGAAEPLLFWCDVALSDERYAPRKPLTVAEINPNPLTLPARGLSVAYFYDYMLAIYQTRLNAQVSMIGDYAAGLATIKDMDRLCRPWLDEQWLVGQLEQVRRAANDPRAFSEARERARTMRLRWNTLEQSLIGIHYDIQLTRFRRDSEPSRAPDVRTIQDHLIFLQQIELPYGEDPQSETRAKKAVNWMKAQADGHDFIAWPLKPSDPRLADRTRWVLHIAGCLEDVDAAKAVAHLPKDDPQRPKTMDTPDLCLEDNVVPCPLCRPCRWADAEGFSKKLRTRLPFLVQATAKQADGEDLAWWHEDELLALLRAFCDSPTDGLNGSLRQLCEHECASDRRDRRWQAFAFQCLGKTIEEDDLDWLVKLYGESLPFDARANIGAAVGSLHSARAAQTLARWIEQEPYYFVRHSLQASLARSVFGQWIARRSAARARQEAGAPEEAMTLLKSLAGDVQRAGVLEVLTRRMRGWIYADLADAAEAAKKPLEERLDYHRKAISFLEDGTPTLANMLNGLAYALATDGRELDGAEQAIRKALEIQQRLRDDDPTFDDTYMIGTLALVLYKQGRLEAAKEAALQCVNRSEGQMLEIYSDLGDILWAMDDRAAAKEAWTKGLSLMSDTDEDRERAQQVRKKLAR